MSLYFHVGRFGNAELVFKAMGFGTLQLTSESISTKSVCNWVQIKSPCNFNEMKTKPEYIALRTLNTWYCGDCPPNGIKPAYRSRPTHGHTRLNFKRTHMIWRFCLFSKGKFFTFTDIYKIEIKMYTKLEAREIQKKENRIMERFVLKLNQHQSITKAVSCKLSREAGTVGYKRWPG